MWDQVGTALNASMVRVLSQFASLLPGILVLILALLLSAVIAWILAAILRRSLTGLDFDRRVPKWGFSALVEWAPSHSPTILVSRSVAVCVMIIGFLIGISAFDVALTSEMVLRFFEYLPKVVAAAIVLVAGTVTSRFLARAVLIGAVNMHLQYAPLLSAGVRWLVMVLTVAMAFEDLAIGGGIIRLAFGILFGGIVLALSLAVGLGSKDVVSRSLERETARTPSPSTREPVGHL